MKLDGGGFLIHLGMKVQCKSTARDSALEACQSAADKREVCISCATTTQLRGNFETEPLKVVLYQVYH